MFLNTTNTDEQLTAVNQKRIFGTTYEHALTILIPTRNESGNVAMLLSRIEQAIGDIDTEVLFVDDSTDDTPQVIIQLKQQFKSFQVELLHRPLKERTGGLGGAVVAGMQAARSPLVCVMDGDLQHPPELIPQMFAKAESGPYDLVVASRRVANSDATSLGTARTIISKGLDLIARILFPRQLHGVTDPLTGFFLVRLDAIDLPRLQPNGFKILMEILVRNPQLRKAELPFRFGERLSGKSKASSKEAYMYLKLLLRLRLGDKVFHFSKFALVGISGIFVNTAALALFTDVMHVHYLVSAIFSTVASTTWNFLLTEFWVFDSRGKASGRLKRYGMFFIMNNIALLFRGPILYVLTSILGVYYLISNLISLGVLTIARYFLADNWIWSEGNTGKNPLRSIF